MRRPLLPVEEYVAGIRRGDRVVLAKAITLVESLHPDHRERAEAVMDKLLENGSEPETRRIAITGAPGVGKSTFIEVLGLRYTALGRKVAVLAIDPSSAESGGSIMGDKTRMERLSADPLAFIRPSPAGETLGGVARKTREVIFLVEAAGYHTVILETVGVGQSEIAAFSMTDLFLLLLLPGAGDELQGIKRGIVEMADILAVNKADGGREALAEQAQMFYRQAVHLLPARMSGWTPVVRTCSAETGKGMETLAGDIDRFFETVRQNGHFQRHRSQQARHWFREALRDELLTAFERHPAVQALLRQLESEVEVGKKSPFAAAAEMVRLFKKGS